MSSRYLIVQIRLGADQEDDQLVRIELAKVLEELRKNQNVDWYTIEDIAWSK